MNVVWLLRWQQDQSGGGSELHILIRVFENVDIHNLRPGYLQIPDWYYRFCICITESVIQIL